MDESRAMSVPVRMSATAAASAASGPTPGVAGAGTNADTAPERWRMLALLSTAELLGMSLWFAASAVSAQYQVRWSLTPAEVAWLTTVVQLGFVVGTAISALLNLADIVPAR